MYTSGHILYIGCKDNSGTGGVGFLIRNDLARNDFPQCGSAYHLSFRPFPSTLLYLPTSETHLEGHAYPFQPIGEHAPTRSILTTDQECGFSTNTRTG